MAVMSTVGRLSFCSSESGIRHRTASVSGFTPGGRGVGTPGLIGSDELLVRGLAVSETGTVVGCSATVFGGGVLLLLVIPAFPVVGCGTVLPVFPVVSCGTPVPAVVSCGTKVLPVVSCGTEVIPVVTCGTVVVPPAICGTTVVPVVGSGAPVVPMVIVGSLEVVGGAAEISGVVWEN